jgi:hypothetical protein
VPQTEKARRFLQNGMHASFPEADRRAGAPRAALAKTRVKEKTARYGRDENQEKLFLFLHPRIGFGANRRTILG